MNFNKWAESANIFMNDLAGALETDVDSAFRLTRAVIHTLRDRIPTAEGKDLVAQLPMFLKAVWADGWDPTLPPDKSLLTKSDFVDRVISDPVILFGKDLDDDLAHAERQVQTVLHAIRDQLSEGEAEDVRGQLPRELQSLWD
jgi:uncharacterized protein (DUF2267 family)